MKADQSKNSYPFPTRSSKQSGTYNTDKSRLNPFNNKRPSNRQMLTDSRNSIGHALSHNRYDTSFYASGNVDGAGGAIPGEMAEARGNANGSQEPLEGKMMSVNLYD